MEGRDKKCFPQTAQGGSAQTSVFVSAQTSFPGAVAVSGGGCSRLVHSCLLQRPPEDAAEEGGAASVRSHTGVVGAVLCRSGSLRVWKLKELSHVTQLEVGAGEGTCHLSVSHHCRAGTEVSKQGFPLRSQPGQTRQLLPGPIHTSTQDSCPSPWL